MEKFTAIVLAAGKGVRMKSPLPKVLHDLRGKSILYYVLKELQAAKKYIKQIIVVVGYKGEAVKKSMKKEFRGIDFVQQRVISGTASAVKCAQSKVKNKNVLVLCGDAPLINRDTFSNFLSFFIKKKFLYSVITAHLDGKNALGAVLRDNKGYIKAIREKVDLSKGHTGKEVNSGVYAFQSKSLFNNLNKIKRNKKKKEYFLTDIIELLYNQGVRVFPYLLDDSDQIMGINSVKDLCLAEKLMQKRILYRLIEEGVKVIDPETTFVSEGVKIGKGTVIFPFTFIEKNVIIGSNCSLGPFIRLRPGTRIKNRVFLGNFVEINRSNIDGNVVMKHFGYVGDTTVKEGVNIGAGTVVANYDGLKKYKTLIDKQAFIGSDTILVAPVKVGKGASTGAGSVITKNVKPKTVVVGVPARLLRKKKG